MYDSIASPREKHDIDVLYAKHAKGAATSKMLRRVHDYFMVNIGKKDIPWYEKEIHPDYAAIGDITRESLMKSIMDKAEYLECPVCLTKSLKTKNKLKQTCSSVCAGKFAAEKRYFKKLQERYSSSEKVIQMQGIILQIFKFFPYGYNPETFNLNILQFYGGGVFYDLLDDHLMGRNFTTTSIDMDDGFKSLLNQERSLNHYTIPGEKLSDALNNPKHQKQFSKQFDVIYLDYCGPWTEDKLQDLELLFKTQPFSNPYSLFFITLNRSREFYKGESKVFVRNYEDVISAQINRILGEYGSSKHIYKDSYIHGRNKMITLGYVRGKPREIVLPNSSIDQAYPNISEKSRYMELQSKIYSL